MRNYVYLFELDSVRKTDTEIIAGQKALYDEIVINGNIVVMTFNQLVDSRGFFSLLNDPKYQNQLISLFENGAIRISQYDDVRTFAQYLINSVASDKQFIYSALPVKYSQKRLLALIKRSLIYSDLSEIYEYYTGLRTKDELIDLFVEIDENNIIRRSDLISESTIDPTEDDTVIREMKNILESLYSLLLTVLKLSAMHTIYINPRNPDEYSNYKLHHLLKIVVNFENLPDENWIKAVSIINSLQCFRTDNDNRSVYLREIKECYGKLDHERQENNLTAFQYAELIVNLCYNYACEISICNISKHYDFSELAVEDMNKISFRNDFISRFYQDWNNGIEAEERYLTDEKEYFEEFTQMKKIPYFAKAVRFTKYVSYKDEGTENIENDVISKDKQNKKIYRYEYNLKGRIRNQKKSVVISILRKGVIVIICLAISGILKIIFDFLEISTDIYFSNGTVFKTCTFLLLSELVTSIISCKFPGFLSLSDALSRAWYLFIDLIYMLVRKSSTYYNKYNENILYYEKTNKSDKIDYLISPEVKKYIDLVSREKAGMGLFQESDVYPIMELNKKDDIRLLVRFEEIYQYRFGVIYRSSYNTLLVDPIRKGNTIYPYERICPSSNKSGVVIIPVYQKNFILMKQYRHAPRKVQYSFPRGFADPECTPEENAMRELKEEIGAVVTKSPKLIGRVISDSGLTSAKVYVFYVEVADYKPNGYEYEGIKELIKIPFSDMEQWIREGNTDDGFTLSAYALYKCR